MCYVCAAGFSSSTSFSLSPGRVFPLLPPFPRYAASVEPVRALSPRFHLHSSATSFFFSASSLSLFFFLLLLLLYFSILEETLEKKKKKK